MMHPADARARGIAEGERVEVFNDRGRFQAEAQVSDEVRHGVVVDAARLLGVELAQRPIGQRRQRLALRRSGPRADVLRHAGGGETSGSVGETVSWPGGKGHAAFFHPVAT